MTVDKKLTPRNDDPDEIEEKVVEPKVIGLWPPMGEPFVVMIKHACRVVQNIAVDLSHRNQGLERISERMLMGDQESDNDR